MVSKKQKFISRVQHFVICVSSLYHHNYLLLRSLFLWVTTPLKDLMNIVSPLSRRKKMHTFPYIIVSLKPIYGPSVKNLWSSLPLSLSLYKTTNRPKEGRRTAQGYPVSLQRIETSPSLPSLSRVTWSTVKICVWKMGAVDVMQNLNEWHCYRLSWYFILFFSGTSHFVTIYLLEWLFDFFDTL